MEFGWVFPSTGDGSRLGTQIPEREVGRDLVEDVARKADAAPLGYVLVTTGFRNNHFGAGASYSECVTTATALVMAMRNTDVMLAIRPGFIHPATFARMGGTIDTLSEGRLRINLVSGGAPLAVYGETLGHDERHARSREFLSIVQRLWSGEMVDHAGGHFRLEGAAIAPAVWHRRRVPIYISGTSVSARALCRDMGDVMLVPSALPSALAELLPGIKRDIGGKPVGTHYYLMARPNRQEAEAALHDLMDSVDPDALYGAPEKAHRPIARLGECFFDALGRIADHPAPCLAGSYDDVAEVLVGIGLLGIETVILQGYPVVDAIERFAAEVHPRVQRLLAERRFPDSDGCPTRRA